jgi:predicted oxidoreductase
MSSMRDIKQRIENVRSVEQIIKAMDMVASTKLVKIRSQLEGVRPIYHELKRVVEELAEAINLDPSALKNTVENYNSYCAKGKDEEFNKDPQFLNTIGQGPYYAVKMASYAYNTCAGLDVNNKLQVLNTSGQPIEGLFCVGSDCAGVLFSEKKPYVTYGGANNGWVLTSGYVCGESVADYVKNK